MKRMRSVAVAVCAACLCGWTIHAEEAAKTVEKPEPPKPEVQATGPTTVVIVTTLGTIKAELWADKAPKTVENFLTYVKEGFFDGLIFHRVIPRFMIQCGGFTPDMQKKQTHDSVQNEARSDTPNKRGTLAMARTGQIHSATAQFFINLVDNAFLNHRSKTPQGFGYCVFGQVTEGMEIVDKIGKVKTGRKGMYSDVPVEPVVIESVNVAK